MVWGAFLAAGASLAGSALSSRDAGKANEASLASTREQMDFQERMRNTQYQAAVADMKKAGINPMVAYSQGGASSPGGSSFTAQNEGASYADAGRSVSSAIQLRSQQAQIDALEANAEKALADADLARENKTSQIYNQVNTQANTNLAYEQTQNVRKQGKILDENYATAKGQATAARNAEAVENSIGKKLRYVDRVVESLSPFK